MAVRTILTVETKVFYTINYNPVRGIEIKGTQGKFRFGSGLHDSEKAWLVADLKESILRSQNTDSRALSTAIHVS